MSPKRLYRFVRDLWTELPVVWSIARTNDCERRGGHFFEEAKYDKALKAWGSECSGCGVWQSSSIQPFFPWGTTATGSQFQITYNATGGPSNGR